LWIRNYFFRIWIRILGFVILNYNLDLDPGGQFIMDPDPDPTCAFLWSLTKVGCQTGIKSLNIINVEISIYLDPERDLDLDPH
jgi:hypothetical protein